MKHLLSVIFLLIINIIIGYAQNKQLSIKEIGDGTEVHLCGSRHEAAVVFEVNDDFSLTFRSNLDDELDISVDSIDNKKIYTLVLITQEPGVSYSSRELYLHAPSFEDLILPLDLKDREKHIYRVWDQNSIFIAPFYTYQEKANELFSNGEYQSARDYYKLTRSCPEYPSDSANINQHIMDCDSLIEWSLRAEEHEHFSEWEEALNTYRSMMRLNSGNGSIRERYYNCMESFRSDCEAEFRNGEHYMSEGSVEDLQKAAACFQRVIDRKCPSQLQEASINLRNVKRQIDKENDHSRCLMYDAGLNQFIGLTFAHCNNRENKRHGGYITFRLNPEIIALASKKGYAKGTFTDLDKLEDQTPSITITNGKGKGNFTYSNDYDNDEAKEEWYPKDYLDYEAQLTWGWTNQLYRWFFIHYGFGYHGGGFYTFSTKEFKSAVSETKSYNVTNWKDEKSWTDKFRNAYSEKNWYHGAALEIGTIVKVYRFCLKGTYQYTQWFNGDEYEAFFNKQQHAFYFGVGFNW